MRWLGGFGGIVLLVLPLLYIFQLWAIYQGYPIRRSDAEFERFSASVWTYLFPWNPRMLFCQVLPDFYKVEGVAGRVPSYLGVVTLGLLGVAALRAAPLRARGFCWLSLITLVVLSLGAYWSVGTWKIPLPAYWIREYALIFKPLRVPGRFNLPAAVFASIIAGAGFKALLAGVARPRRRLLLGATLAGLAVADLAIVPFGGVSVPPLPAFYGHILSQKPDATILEAPYPSYRIDFLSAASLWQSQHGARTSVGYSAVDFQRLLNLLQRNSPFDSALLADPGYLADPEHQDFDLTLDQRFEDYAWLYLKVHGFDFLALHKRGAAYHAVPVALERLQAHLEPARCYEDAEAVVYDCARLRPPARPVLLCAEGWRERVPVRGRRQGIVDREACVYVYVPEGSEPVQLSLEASGYQRARVVRLMEGSRELARWIARPARLGGCFRRLLR